MEAQLIAHVSHFILPIRRGPFDVEFRRPPSSLSGRTGVFRGWIHRVKGCGAVGWAVWALTRPSIDCFSQRALQYLHDAMCIGMVMYRRAFARSPDQDEL